MLLAVLVVLAGLLITPIRFRLQLTNTPHVTYRLDLHLAGGLTPGIKVAHGPQHEPKSALSAKPVKPKLRKTSRKPTRFRGSMVRALPDLISDVFSHIHLKELRIDADYGLDDPADTGQICGLLMPLQYSAPLPSFVSLNLRPDFMQRCLKGTLTAAVQVTIASFFVPALRFGWRAFGPAR